MIKFRKFERSPKEKGWGFGHIRIDDFKIEHLNYQIDAYMIAVPPGRTTIRFWKRTTVKIAKREFTIPGFTLIDWEHRSLSWQVWREIDQ